MTFKCTKRGAGGIPAFADAVDESKVQYGLVQVVMGSALARSKNIFIHFNGKSCSVVKRGRANAQKPLAQDAVGHFHAEVAFEEKEEVTFANVLSNTSGVFIDDDNDVGAEGGGGDAFAERVAAMQKDYEEMALRNAQQGPGGEAVEDPGSLTAKEMRNKPPAEQALAAVRELMGPFNWATFNAKVPLELENAGAGSVPQMREWLPNDEVVFGLVRMGFGTGRFRRTYWYYFHWCGPDVGAVKRGRCNAHADGLAQLMSPFSLKITAHALDEYTLEGCLDSMARAIVVEGEAKGDEAGANPLSLDSFMAALDEEATANRDFFQAEMDARNEEKGDAEEGEFDLAETINAVKDDSNPITWCLVEVA